MAKSNSFIADIGKAPSPVSPDGGLLISASEKEAAAYTTQAKGDAITRESNIKGATDLANLGREAYKGKLKSDLESEIRKTIDDYDRSTQVATAGLKLSLFDQGMLSQTPKEVDDAKAVLLKYKDALSQGTMTRDQALLGIDKQVKEYSRTMPGWAQDFRKLAGEITGIEHLGSYREYQLLSQVGIRDKALKDAADFKQKMDEKQITMFVETYKRLPAGGLEGNEMSLFRENAALKQAAEGLKEELSARDSTVLQNEPKVQNLVNLRLANGMMDLSQQIQGIVNEVDPKTGKPLAPESRVILRQQVVSNTNKFFETLKGEVLGLSTNQVSSATREQLLARIGTQQKDLITSLQNQDTFDDFKRTMEIAQSRSEGIMHNWAIAHPHLEIIRKSGMATPENATFWVSAQQDPRRAADFIRLYGKGLSEYYTSVLGGGVGAANRHTNDMVRSATEPGYLAALKSGDKAAHQAAVLSIRDHVQKVSADGWGETPETQTVQKNNFGTAVAALTNEINATDPGSLEAWTKLMADPRVAARIKELPPEQQTIAMQAIAGKSQDILQNPDFGVMKRLTNLNTNNPGYLALGIDPMTGKLVATFPDIEQEKVTKKPHEQKSVVRLSSISAETKNLLTIANRAIQSLENIGIVPTDRAFAEDIRQKFNAGYFGMDLAAREKALTSAAGGKKEPEGTAKVGGSDSKVSTEKEALKGMVQTEEEQLQIALNEYLNMHNNLKEIDSELARSDTGPKQREILLKQKQEILSVNPEEIRVKLQRLLSISKTGEKKTGDKKE